MSQNALLDRESADRTTEIAPVAASMTEPLPVTRAQREHLTLLDWDLNDLRVARRPAAQEWTPVRPARRPWFGWHEAIVLLLLVGSGVAAVISLLRLG